MNVASFDLVEFKAMDGDQGLFAARVSAFGNVDRGGDRVIKGAFKKTIDKWRKSTKKVPVIFSHDWKVIEHYIGTVDPKSMQETNDGLVVAGQLDIHDNPKAMRVFKKLQDGSLSGWSFGYEVKEERTAEDGARDLLEVDLLELGPTLVGMNEQAITLGTKDALEDLSSGPTEEPVEVKEEPQTVTVTETLEWTPEIEQKVGRALSAKREAQLRAIHKQLADFLSEFGTDLDDVEEASSTPEATVPVFGEKELLRRDIDEATVFVAERTA